MSSALPPKPQFASKVSRSYSYELLDKIKRNKQIETKPPMSVRDAPHPLLQTTPRGPCIKPLHPFFIARHVDPKKTRSTGYKVVGFMRKVEIVPQIQWDDKDDDNNNASEQYHNYM